MADASVTLRKFPLRGGDLRPLLGTGNHKLVLEVIPLGSAYARLLLALRFDPAGRCDAECAGHGTQSIVRRTAAQ
jgi:hypothetical protein